jgi:hypothetical protein
LAFAAGLCVVLAASAAASAGPQCAFRLSIALGDTAERGLTDETAQAIMARYVEVLKDDLVFTGGETKELRLQAGAFTAGVPAIFVVTANRACDAALLSDVERIAASARERWRERVWRYDEPGQGLALEIAVEMLP